MQQTPLAEAEQVLGRAVHDLPQAAERVHTAVLALAVSELLGTAIIRAEQAAMVEIGEQQVQQAVPMGQSVLFTAPLARTVAEVPVLVRQAGLTLLTRQPARATGP
jgi:hypothetical protein